MNNKKVYVFMLLFFQSFLAIIAGLLVLYFTIGGKISANVYIGPLDVGKLKKEEATQKTKNYFADILENKELVIKFENGKQVKIRYKDFSAKVDVDKSVEMAYGGNKHERFDSFFNGYFSGGKKIITPVFEMDEAKLKEKLAEVSPDTNKEPQNADIYIRDNKIEKVPEVNGLRLNVENAAKKVHSEMEKAFNTPVTFKASNNFEIEEVIPKVTMRDLEPAKNILSSVTREIKSSRSVDSAILACEAINKVLIYPADLKTGETAGEFSFNKYLQMENATKEANDEGYNAVVTALNQALLEAGISKESIKATISSEEESGKLKVLGNEINYTFHNTLNDIIILFAEVKNTQININIVGKKKL